MFVLVELRDTVSIPPWLFHIKLHDAVSHALNKKFANKASLLGCCNIKQANGLEARTDSALFC